MDTFFQKDINLICNSEISKNLTYSLNAKSDLYKSQGAEMLKVIASHRDKMANKISKLKVLVSETQSDYDIYAENSDNTTITILQIIVLDEQRAVQEQLKSQLESKYQL